MGYLSINLICYNKLIFMPAVKSDKNKKPNLASKKQGLRRDAARKTAGKSAVNKKSVRKLPFKKFIDNPIIAPRQENKWEAWQTFNPGAVQIDGKIHFLYRAIGNDGLSRFGYAASDDGFTVNERLPYPVYEHRSPAGPFISFSFASGGSVGGCEDPRVVKVKGEDTLYMTYTACDAGLRVGLTSIKLNDFLKKKWRWFPPVLISPPGETHKNWVIFPEKIKGKYAILHSISPEIQVAYFNELKFKPGQYIKSSHNGVYRKNCWDSWMRGAGPPPVKTKYGWLIFYHAINERDPGKYKIGAMLLDLYDPSKVICRLKEPILEPDEAYENNGFKSGVIYASGAVVKNKTLFLYYGASDNYVCVAYAGFDEFVESLRKEVKPKLRRKIIRQL